MHFGALDYIGIKTKNPVNEKFTGFCICLLSILAEKEGMEPNLQYLDNVLFTGS